MPEIKETMLTYIEESPEVILKNVARSKELTASLVNEFVKKDYKTIWIIACGSSYNGSYCARPFIRKHLNVEVKIVTPLTFSVDENNFGDDDFIFVVSQSGYSTNSIDALEKIKAKGHKAIGITMDLNSDFKDHADILIDYGIGFETVGFVTKGVTGFALYMMLFTVEAAKAKGILSEAEAESYKQQMSKCSEIHKQVQKDTYKFIEDNYLDLTSMTQIMVCGVGAGYGVACEGALKLGETFLVSSMPLETDEYLHGPSLRMNPNNTVFSIDCGVASTRIKAVYEGNKVVTNRSYLITNDEKYANDKYVLVVNTKGIDNDILPLCYLPFFQLIAYKITDACKKWTSRHPGEEVLEKTVASKTERYIDRVEH